MHLRPFIPRDWPICIGVAVCLSLLPLWLGNDYFLLLFNVMALNALVVLGLNLLIGSAGQISFGHAAFYGLGAYVSAIACTTWHWPLPAGLVLALLVVGLTAFLLALPTLRLEGHYLVMATLGFNIIVCILLNQLEDLTGGPSGFPGIARLSFCSFVINSDRRFYGFIWTVVLLGFALTANLGDSRIGRALQAIHERDLTARSLGIPTYRYKVTTFVLSALYAALAGFCYAHYMTFISPKTFDIFYSVQVVTMVVVGGMGSLWGGFLGAVLLTALPELLHSFEDLHVLFYGLILMGVLVFCPRGLLPYITGSGPVRKIAALLTSGVKHDVPAGQEPAGEPAAIPVTPQLAFSGVGAVPLTVPERQFATSAFPASHAAYGESPQAERRLLLALDGVSLSFGGLQALHDVSMEVYSGEVVALIGPNGAGKTTVLNVISGLIRPNEGEVRFTGKPVTHLPAHRIAALGLGRTFQAVQVFQKMTVLENVLLGCHVHGRYGFLPAFLHTPCERREEGMLRERAVSLLKDFDLSRKAHLPARQLSLLEQKLLELVRALALSPSVLLLDEPVGGLNPRESALLVDAVSLLRRRGMGMLLVEHDMNVVMGLSDRVVVLQHGIKIAEGTPKEVQRNERVIAAYLGRKRA